MSLMQSIGDMVKLANERLPNRKREKCQWFNMKSNDDDTADLMIYDEIGYWGTTAADFKNALDSVKEKKTLNVSINSPGGDVFDGFAIYNQLKGFDGRINVTIDGLAASIASVVAMAGDNVAMPKNSVMMIHNPWVFAAGESDDLRNMADLLDLIKDNAITVYKGRVNDLDRDAIATMMDATTWMNADKAKEDGFADEVIENTEIKNSVDLAKLDAPEEIKVQFSTAIIPANPTGAGGSSVNHKLEKNRNHSTEKGVDMTITQEQLDAQVKEASEKASADATNAAQQKFTDCYNSLIGTAKVLGYDDQEKLSEIVNKVVGDEITEAQAKDEIIAAHKEKMEVVPPATPAVKGGLDSIEKYSGIAAKSLAMSAGLKLSDEDKVDVTSNGYGAMTLQTFCRDYLNQVGVANVHRMSGPELYNALAQRPRNATAAGTDHFSSVLEDVANKSLETGWEEAPVTYREWTGKKTVNNFLQHNMTRMSPFSDVEEIKEGEGFRYAQMADTKETVTVKTWGKAFSLTRQAIINDTLDAFSGIPQAMASSIARKVDRSVYDLLTSATFVGPTMNEDGVALFDTATHGNYLAASSGAAISVSTISAGETAMMTRALLSTGDKKSGSVYTETAPEFIVVPTTAKTTAEQVILSPRDAAATNDIKYNPYTGLRIISSAYLNSKSTTRWYLAAPSKFGTIVVATLSGFETPTARSQNSGVADPLGVVMDIYFDFETAAADWRYLYQNAGV